MREPSVSPDAYRERLRWHLQRVDYWIGNADSKATILLGINGALVAALITIGKDSVTSMLTSSWLVLPIAAVFAGSLFWSTYHAACAIFPDIGLPEDKQREPSLFHFKTVADYQLGMFRNLYREMTGDDDLLNLENQVHATSDIVTTKFARIKKSVHALRVTLITGLTLFVLSLFI